MLQLSTHEVVEVCGKILYQVELARNTLNTMWGFSVEAELVENNEKQVWKYFNENIFKMNQNGLIF